MKQLLLAGVGLTVLPALAVWDELERGDLVALNVSRRRSPPTRSRSRSGRAALPPRRTHSPRWSAPATSRRPCAPHETLDHSSPGAPRQRETGLGHRTMQPPWTSSIAHVMQHIVTVFSTCPPFPLTPSPIAMITAERSMYPHPIRFDACRCRHRQSACSCDSVPLSAFPPRTTSRFQQKSGRNGNFDHVARAVVAVTTALYRRGLPQYHHGHSPHANCRCTANRCTMAPCAWRATSGRSPRAEPRSGRRRETVSSSAR